MVWFKDEDVRQLMETLNISEAQAKAALKKATSIEGAFNYIFNQKQDESGGAGSRNYSAH